MSDIALIPEITLAGLQAAWNADRTGIAAEITHIGLGDAGYVPSKGQTALQSEQNRIPVAGGELAGPTQIHLTAIEDGDSAYWVREVGFFLADGTLFAVWSSDVGPLAYKTAGFNLIVAFDLDLAALPADSITVSVTGALNLFLATELTRMATASVGTMHRQTLQQMRTTALEDRVKSLETTVAGLRDALNI